MDDGLGLIAYIVSD